MARRRTPDTESPVDPSVPLTDAGVDADPVSKAVSDAIVDPEPVPIPSVVAAEPPPAAVAQRGPGLFGPLLGGALAAVAGFGLAHFNAFGLASVDTSAELAALSGRIDALESAPPAEPADLAGLKDTLSGLQTRVTALEDAPALQPPDLSALETLEQRLAAIEAMPSGGEASTAALAAKLADIEERLAAQPQGGVDTAEVDAALARLEAAEAEATARASEAAEAAASAQRAMAVDRLREAAASGAAFEAELAAMADPAMTAALTPYAAGVATLATLQAEFPDLVREALEVARTAEGDQGWGTRMMNFLSSQTGARPLTPQDGTTPEAILSRADFAVTEGRLADALAEIATLPPDVQAVFADWTARATARIAVDTALEAQ
jgi:hypothetical protein